MKKQFRLLLALAVLTLAFFFTAPAANAKDPEYKALVNHVKTKYKAKKIGIPFMWLAKFAVGIVRPAGLKSFSISIFKDLHFSADADAEMRETMTGMFDQNWTPILRVRSKDGERVYMNMREDGKDIKIFMMVMDSENATLIRARFNPDKLADFISNPKIFGISLDSKDKAKSLDKKSDN